VTVIGRYEGKGKITASNIYFKPLAQLIGVYPVYPFKEGIKQGDIANHATGHYENLIRSKMKFRSPYVTNTVSSSERCS
jgi:hypothetical protein